MGKMNLLKADFTGSLGEYTGAHDKGQSVIKAKIWSKAPPSPKQTSNVRAFEALNRLASIIAKKMWYFLPLKQGNLHKHNVVAQWLKPIIKNHVYEPENIAEVILPGNAITVSEFAIDTATGELRLNASCSLGAVLTQKARWFLAVADSKGVILAYVLGSSTSASLAQFVPLVNDGPYYLIGFTSEWLKRNGKEQWVPANSIVLKQE